MEVVVLNCCVYSNKGDTVLLEDIDQLSEIHERARDPVNLVNYHYIDLACLDVGEKALQRRPRQCRAADASIIVPIWDEQPPLPALARDVGLAGGALGI